MRIPENILLENKITDFIYSHSHSERAFEELALQIFGFQYRHNSIYRQFCDYLGQSPRSVRRWHQIPAMSVEAFKRFAVTSIDHRKALRIFRTSGTTQGETGAHYYQTLSLYRRAIKAPFYQYVMPDRGGFEFYGLLQSAIVNPSSSLSFMVDFLAEEMGYADESRFYVSTDRVLDSSRLKRDLRKATKPVLLFATTFSLYDFLTYLQTHQVCLRLPAGSRVVQTGGFKGRQITLSSQEMERLCSKWLGIPSSFVIGEYGMTELTSQYYQSGLYDKVHKVQRQPVYLSGPWLRPVVVDEASRPVKCGQIGALRHFDLANLYSVMAIETQDLGQQHEEGFTLMGRSSKASARGCSLSYEHAGLASKHRPSYESPRKILGRKPVFRTDKVSMSLLLSEIDKISSKWLQRKFAYRIQAIELLRNRCVFAPAMSAKMLDCIFLQLRKKPLMQMLIRELGSIPEMSDVIKPVKAMHVLASNAPNAGIQSIALGLLSAHHNVVKISCDDVGVLELYIRSIQKYSPVLGKRVTYLHDSDKAQSEIRQSDAVIVYGDNQTVDKLSSIAPAKSTFIGYGQKISFAVIENEITAKSIAGCAQDIWLSDQRGCMSPIAVFVKGHGRAKSLAEALSISLAKLPHLRKTPSAFNVVWAMQNKYQKVYSLKNSPWLIGSKPIESAANFVWTPGLVSIFSYADIMQVTKFLKPLKAYLQTLTLSASGYRYQLIASKMGKLGFNRVCDFGQAQNPPIDYPHDGMPNIALLVRK